MVPSKAAGNQPGDAKFGPPQGAIKNVNLEVKQAISFVKRDGWGVNILVVPSKGAGKLMLVLGTETGVENPVVPSKVAGSQMGPNWELLSRFPAPQKRPPNTPTRILGGGGHRPLKSLICGNRILYWY